MDNMGGIATVDYLFHNRDARVRQLKKEGRKILGYLCYFAPPELIVAAGLIPYRLMGKVGESTEDADKCLESYGCPYIRNCFEQDLRGRLDFLDGIVMAHSCDLAQRIYGIWVNRQKPCYSYLFNVPHQITPWSEKFFMRELQFFRESLEQLMGKRISEKDIYEAISLNNRIRDLMKDLYEMRKENPPLISGSEIMKIAVVGMSIPPEEFLDLLLKVKDEVLKREVSKGKVPRLMVWGCIMDHIKLIKIIEDCGAEIVIDDTCIGSRSYFSEVDPSLGVIQGLTKKYFKDFMCPRTDRGISLDRFEYVYHLACEYQVEGVIAYLINYCDAHKLDYPDFRDYLKSKGLPVLPIEDDYSLNNTEALRNRLEAFLEML